MLSLPGVLLEAEERGALEVVMRAGAPPTIRGDRGRETIGEMIDESALFEALTRALSPEQQAELAVGNVVEFKVHGHVQKWTFVAEAGTDGVTVRGRRSDVVDAPDERQAPIELPPLSAFDADADAGEAAETPLPPRRRTQLDIGVSPWSPGDDPPWSGPFETLAVPRSGDGVSPLPPPPPMGELRSDGAAVDFAIVPPNAMEEELVPEDVPLSARPRTPSAPPIPATPAIGLRALSELAPIAERIAPATICFLPEGTIGEALAYAAGAPVEVLDEPRSVDLPGRMLAELIRGATYLVRVEDPSRWVAWILRRVEEGSRILVETRARTLAGATRSLVGVAGAAAERWLAMHDVLWLSEVDGTWQLEAGGLPQPRAREGSGTQDAARQRARSSTDAQRPDDPRAEPRPGVTRPRA